MTYFGGSCGILSLPSLSPVAMTRLLDCVTVVVPNADAMVRFEALEVCEDLEDAAYHVQNNTALVAKMYRRETMCFGTLWKVNHMSQRRWSQPRWIELPDILPVLSDKELSHGMSLEINTAAVQHERDLADSGRPNMYVSMVEDFTNNGLQLARFLPNLHTDKGVRGGTYRHIATVPEGGSRFIKTTLNKMRSRYDDNDTATIGMPRGRSPLTEDVDPDSQEEALEDDNDEKIEHARPEISLDSSEKEVLSPPLPSVGLRSAPVSSALPPPSPVFSAALVGGDLNPSMPKLNRMKSKRLN